MGVVQYIASTMCGEKLMSWLIDPPGRFAPIEVIEQWLFDTDIAIENAKSAGERDALTKAHAKVPQDLLVRRGPGLADRMDADRR